MIELGYIRRGAFRHNKGTVSLSQPSQDLGSHEATALRHAIKTAGARLW